MGYNTISTDWPSFPVPDDVKQLIDKFFNLLDSQEANVGDTLADDVFAPDAIATFGPHVFEGTEKIRGSRKNAWGVVTKRRHTVLKVFASSAACDDLLFIAYVAMDFNNGNSVAGESIGRTKIVRPDGTNARLASYNIWADSAPMAKALQAK
ncbi:hypothetical protein VTL71DRAFT_6862 [Oculimacula yallundae]|uniref:SnoaL-like domain-containing protein n=1 Tax=Oculimacula yallundae TaxID=86028 RepID=A0ABR4BV41_9HELO